jgi:phosphomannomutase
MPPQKLRFGTDGWRGRIGFDFTFENLARAAAAAAGHFLARGVRRAHVGWDRRFLSRAFARRAARVLRARGVEAAVSERDLPTPALSWSVAARGDCFGIMITASHNPPEFNGFKVKEPDGASLSDEVARDLEGRAALERGGPPADGAPEAAGPEIAEEDWVPSHLAALAERVDLDRIRARDWTVLFDAMHGCAGRLPERLLSGGRARVLLLRPDPDVLFGGHPPEPVPEHLAEAARLLRAGAAAVGIVTDGDADRLAAVDERGEFVGAQILTPLIGLHLAEKRGRRGAVAKTFAHTVLLDLLAADLGLPLRVRPIGFKHLGAILRGEPVLVAGEESGGIGVGGFIPERDGLLAGLLALEALCERGQTLAEAAAALRRRFGDFHYRRIDLRSDPAAGHAAVEALEAALPARLGGLPVSGVDRLDGLKCLLGEDGWILFRQSGTEPVFRIYAETRGRERLEPLLADARRLLAAHLPGGCVPARPAAG